MSSERQEKTRTDLPADTAPASEEVASAKAALRNPSRTGVVVPDLPSDSNPFVTMFTVDTLFDASGLKVEDLPGLLYTETFGGTDGSRVKFLLAWRSRDAFEAARTPLAGRFGLSIRGLEFSGYHLGVTRPHKKWWLYVTPVNLWAAIATVALGLSNLGTIVDSSGWLLGSPLVSVYSATSPVNAVEGGQISAVVTARNGSRGNCTIELLNQVSNPPTAVSFATKPPAAFTNVKPDSTVPYALSGTVSSVGDVSITLTGRARAGLIPVTRPITGTINVTVWPARPTTVAAPSPHWISPDGTLCYSEVSLRCGLAYPFGSEGFATVPAADVWFETVDFRIDKPTMLRAAPGTDKPVATMRWKTPELAAMREEPMLVILESAKAKTRPEWEKVLQSVHYSMTPIRQKETHL